MTGVGIPPAPFGMKGEHFETGQEDGTAAGRSAAAAGEVMLPSG